ncbi:LOW QUALITY PROTEIN: hypothetical protein YC2023_011967 [Brassica napus]
MKRLATRRGSDDIEAKEREAIEPIGSGNADQRNRENPGEKPPSPSRRARRGAKSRIAPSPRATRIKAGYTRQRDRRIPESESPKGIGDGTKLHLDLFFVKDTRERTKKRENEDFSAFIIIFLSCYSFSEKLENSIKVSLLLY